MVLFYVFAKCSGFERWSHKPDCSTRRTVTTSKHRVTLVDEPSYLERRRRLHASWRRRRQGLSMIHDTYMPSPFQKITLSIFGTNCVLRIEYTAVRSKIDTIPTVPYLPEG
jgi:hypothetical protein